MRVMRRDFFIEHALEPGRQRLAGVGQHHLARGAVEQLNNAAINRSLEPIGAKVQGSGSEVVKAAGDKISDQQRDVEKHAFLKAVSPNVRITNSHLSEYGVLGFEYGYTITNPNTLGIFESDIAAIAEAAPYLGGAAHQVGTRLGAAWRRGLLQRL